LKVADHILRKQFAILTDGLGQSATFRLHSGECPENCEDPDPAGPVLVEIPLGPHPFQKRDGQLRLSEGLVGKGAEAAGKGKLARSFRFYGADGTCILQGTVTPPGDDGDLLLDNPSIAAAQNLVVGSFELKMRE
jgi:hypothetical protein